jgi:membrane-bound serine protease (ClpP class)
MQDLVLAFWQLLINPDVVYLLFITGLWAVVAAWTVPGTGLPEVAAATCLTLAFIGLAQLPINLAGLFLIFLSLGLFVADLKVHQSGALLLGGAVALALGSLFLFRVEGESRARVSYWLIALVTLGSGGFFGIALTRVMRAQSRPLQMGLETVVGASGYAVGDLAPMGTVQVRSELWSALADDEPITAGEEVVVVGVEGVKLKVRRRR